MQTETTRQGNPNLFAGGYIPLKVNTHGPETVRAIHHESGLFLIQVFSASIGVWITQGEHVAKDAAIEDALSFY
jgi:hypothetical protein